MNPADTQLDDFDPELDAIDPETDDAELNADVEAAQEFDASLKTAESAADIRAMLDELGPDRFCELLFMTTESVLPEDYLDV